MDAADFHKLKRGRIIFAEVSDMQGRGMKDRPLVIMSVPSVVTSDATVEVICGSTKPPVPENEHIAVEAPGMDQYGGHPRTGLTFTTWFYAPWSRSIEIGHIRRTAKFLPEPEMLKLQKILDDAANA